MAFKLIRNKKNRNPYDLSALKWVCEKCGGEKPPASAYERSGHRRYCQCNRNPKKQINES